MIITADSIIQQKKTMENFTPLTTPAAHVSSTQYVVATFFDSKSPEKVWSTDPPLIDTGWIMRVLPQLIYPAPVLCQLVTETFAYIHKRFLGRDIYPVDCAGSVLSMHREVRNIGSKLLTSYCRSVQDQYDGMWRVTEPINFRIGGRDYSNILRNGLNPCFEAMAYAEPPLNWMSELLFHPDVIKETPAFTIKSNTSAESVELALRFVNNINAICQAARTVFDERASLQTGIKTQRCNACRNASGQCSYCREAMWNAHHAMYNVKIAPMIGVIAHNCGVHTLTR